MKEGSVPWKISRAAAPVMLGIGMVAAICGFDLRPEGWLRPSLYAVGWIAIGAGVKLDVRRGRAGFIRRLHQTLFG